MKISLKETMEKEREQFDLGVSLLGKSDSIEYAREFIARHDKRLLQALWDVIEGERRDDGGDERIGWNAALDRAQSIIKPLIKE